MFPGMTFLIFSRDPDFIADMTTLLHSRQGEVFVATSWEEAERLNAEIPFEMLILDPYFQTLPAA